MPYSIKSLNDIHHEKYCAYLGIDEYHIDLNAELMRPPDEVVEDYTRNIFGNEHHRRREFRCPVVRWRIGKHKFSAAIPINVVAEEFTHFPFSGYTHKIDEPALFKEFERLVAESKKGL